MEKLGAVVFQYFFVFLRVHCIHVCLFHYHCFVHLRGEQTSVLNDWSNRCIFLISFLGKQKQLLVPADNTVVVFLHGSHLTNFNA